MNYKSCLVYEHPGREGEGSPRSVRAAARAWQMSSRSGSRAWARRNMSAASASSRQVRCRLPQASRLSRCSGSVLSAAVKAANACRMAASMMVASM